MAALVAALICLAPLFSTNTAQAAGGDVVSVADYGAAADSGEDSAPAIIKAVDKAKELAAEGKNVTIAFPKGRYDIYPDKAERRTLYVSNTVGANSSYKDKKIGILLEDTKNITVDGQGSDFVFHGKMTTFAAINSQNVTFKNFSVDFQVPMVIDRRKGGCGRQDRDRVRARGIQLQAVGLEHRMVFRFQPVHRRHVLDGKQRPAVRAAL